MGRLQHIMDLEARGRVLIRGWLEARRAEVRPKDLKVAAFLLSQVVEPVAHGAVLHEPALLQKRALVDETVDLVVRYLTK